MSCNNGEYLKVYKCDDDTDSGMWIDKSYFGRAFNWQGGAFYTKSTDTPVAFGSGPDNHNIINISNPPSSLHRSCTSLVYGNPEPANDCEHCTQILCQIDCCDLCTLAEAKIKGGEDAEGNPFVFKATISGDDYWFLGSCEGDGDILHTCSQSNTTKITFEGKSDYRKADSADGCKQGSATVKVEVDADSFCPSETGNINLKLTLEIPGLSAQDYTDTESACADLKGTNLWFDSDITWATGTAGTVGVEVLTDTGCVELNEPMAYCWMYEYNPGSGSEYAYLLQNGTCTWDGNFAGENISLTRTSTSWIFDDGFSTYENTLPCNVGSMAFSGATLTYGCGTDDITCDNVCYVDYTIPWNCTQGQWEEPFVYGVGSQPYCASEANFPPSSPFGFNCYDDIGSGNQYIEIHFTGAVATSDPDTGTETDLCGDCNIDADWPEDCESRTIPPLTLSDLQCSSFWEDIEAERDRIINDDDCPGLDDC